MTNLDEKGMTRVMPRKRMHARPTRPPKNKTSRRGERRTRPLRVTTTPAVLPGTGSLVLPMLALLAIALPESTIREAAARARNSRAKR